MTTELYENEWLFAEKILLDKAKLEAENEQLKEKYENVLIANRKLIKEIDDYQNIIIKMKEQNRQLKEDKKKTIEYIKYNLKSFIYSKEYKDLMEILGDEEND